MRRIIRRSTPVELIEACRQNEGHVIGGWDEEPPVPEEFEED